ncbi:hypothetical protein O6R05_00785 [Peptoniphilus equinus]|uniref:LURP-one-related family protein n=1 Tax=Peptoniphilus equinus TaxID=3016343 RepID=A0ABY7QW34_9FIRM|nr:hypothetical protein [Peptoniphilus equinus]WBW50128.1 hypothetical protein O6R05_00785 [Peptoniphilus equinus]
MKTLKIKCDHSIIDDFKYEVFDGNTLVYEGYVDIFSPIINFLKAEGIYQSKIRVFDMDNKQVLKIYKHVRNFLNDVLFTMFIDDRTIAVREGKNFRVPDLYFRSSFGRLTVFGEVKAQSYRVLLGDDVVLTIQGTTEKMRKTYILSWDESYDKDCLEFVGIALILDSLYHDY